MRKGQLTRQFILEKTAPVFNKNGYGSTTLDDIKEVTGLEKGGIYRHFANKEEIAAEAFDHACLTNLHYQVSAADKLEDGVEKLMAFFAAFFKPGVPIAGGCPVFNTAVENDDGNPLLKKKALANYKRLLKETCVFIDLAKEQGTLSASLDSELTASFLLSAIEGGLIARNLTGKNAVGEGVLMEAKAYLDTKRVHLKDKKKSL